RSAETAPCEMVSSFIASQCGRAPWLLVNPCVAGPAVEVVVGHAALDEGIELGGDAADACEAGHVEAHLLLVAGIVDLVPLVAGAELRADRVPDQLEQLDPVVGAPRRAPVEAERPRPGQAVQADLGRGRHGV